MKREQVKGPIYHFAFSIVAGGFLLYTTAVYAAHTGVPGGSNPWHSDVGTVNLTFSSNVNNPDLRGFDPAPITGPNDVFPDTSRPCCLEGSTMFGNGLPSGSSQESINQNCATLDLSEPQVAPNALREFGTENIVGVPESSPFPTIPASSCVPQITGNVFQGPVLFQQSTNGLRSFRVTVPPPGPPGPPECLGLGPIPEAERCNEITFGFLQQIEGQGQVMDIDFVIASLTDADGNPIGNARGDFTQRIVDGGVERTCSGSFLWNENVGFVMTGGPLHECP